MATAVRRAGAVALAGFALFAAQGPAAAAPEQLATVNHVFAVLDAETAQAVATSTFLRDFAAFKANNVVAGTDSWSGLYIYGRETYLELFAPGPELRTGDIGIALSGDRVGVIDQFRQRLEAAGAKLEVGVRKRTFGTREVDWFHYVGLAEAEGVTPASPGVSIWAMEPFASYFDEPEAAKEVSEGPDDVVSRERNLSDDYATHAMRDVRAVAFDLAREDWPQVRPLLVAAGFKLTQKADGASAAGSVNLSFKFTPRAAARLRRIDFRLNRPMASVRREVIGRSVLTVGPGLSATWIFTAAPPAARS